jgi:hypothetical protein
MTSDEPPTWSVHPVTGYSRPCYANSLPQMDYQSVIQDESIHTVASQAVKDLQSDWYL